MNRKHFVVLIMLTSVFLIGIPEAFARPEYLVPLQSAYGSSLSCGTCHIRPNGGGPRNSYGTLFENQVNHGTDPGAALIAIGPPLTTTTPIITATPVATETLTATPTMPLETVTPAETETIAETASETETPEVTTVTATGTPSTPGFGIALSLVGLFACFFLTRRHNK